MKPYLLNKGLKGIALISLSMMFTSCLEGLPDAPGGSERKKMPRFYDTGLQVSEGWNGKRYTSCGMASEENLFNLNGYAGTSEFYRIPLGDPGADESLFAMINMFKPIAARYLAQWAKTQNRGVLVDFRSNDSQTGLRQEYQLEKDNQFSVPVILVWDASSAFRAQSFVAVLKDLPGIKSKRINNNVSEH